MPEEQLDAEDRKLITLARATRQRARAAEGAALRDTDGRTYAAATVAFDSLQVSAVGAAVAMAVASGATGLEAAVVLGEGDPSDGDLSVLREYAGAGVRVYDALPTGRISGERTT